MHNYLHHNLIQYPFPEKKKKTTEKKEWGNQIYKKYHMHVFKLSLSGEHLILEEHLGTGSPSSCGREL